MKKVLFIYLLFASCLPIFSQDTTDSIAWSKKHNRLGLYGSLMSGGGLAYQYQFENGISLKLQAIAYTRNPEESEHNDLHATMGADIQLNVSKHERYRVYALAGLGYFYNEQNNYKFYKYPYNTSVSHNSSINAGTGIGVEYKLFTGTELSIALEGGVYGSFTRKEEFDANLAMYVIHKKIFTFGGGLGIFYAF